MSTGDPHVPSSGAAYRAEAGRIEAAAFVVLLTAVFTFAFAGVGVGRALFGLSAILVLIDAAVRRRRLPMPRVAALASAFVLATVLATLFGVDPARGGRSLHKLIPWLCIPLVAALIDSPTRLRRTFLAYAMGAGVLCIRTFHASALAARQALNDGAVFHADAWRTLVFHGALPPDDLMARLVNVGDMQDGQRLMVAVLFTLGLLAAAWGKRRERVVWTALLVLQGLAMLLTFKRGAFLSGGIAVLVFLLFETRLRRAVTQPVAACIAKRWKPILHAVLVALLAFGLSPAASRAAHEIRRVTAREIRNGRRLCMWVKIAPALVREHPWGMGFKVLRSEDMQQIVRRIEPRHDHLHSNPIQLLVAAGWIGLALYLLWMTQAVADAAGFARRASSGEAALATGLATALLALLLHGLVEYQFGAGQVVLLYVLIMGAAAAGRRRLTRPV